MEDKDCLDFSLCTICQGQKKGEPTQSLEPDGVLSLWTGLRENEMLTYYHLLQIYDMPRDLETILQESPQLHKSCRLHITRTRKRKSTEATELSVPLSPKQLRSDSTNTPYYTICFLCDKERTTARKNRDRRLLAVTEFDRQTAIHKKAKELQDTKILTKIQGVGSDCVDMIAYGFKYHKICMTTFLNRKPNTESNNSSANPPREEPSISLFSKKSMTKS